MTVQDETVDPLDLPEPERWEPWRNSAHPKILRGGVTEKYTRRSDYGDGEHKNFVNMLTGDGTHWYLSGYSTRIHQELGRSNPQVGDRVGVKFLGMVEREGFKPYPDIKLVDYDRQAAGVQFTADTDEPEAPPASDIPGDDAGEFGSPDQHDEQKDGDGDDMPF